MIFVYNEKKSPVWEITKKNDYFFRLSDGKMGIDISSIGLKDLVLEDIVDKYALTSIDDGNEADNLFRNTYFVPVQKLLDEQTMVVFDKRNLAPFIHSVGDDVKYNNNVFLCAFDIEGVDIYSVRIYNGNIYAYNYDTEDKTLSIAFSLMEGDVTGENGKPLVPSLRIVGRRGDGAYFRKRIITSRDNPEKYVMNFNKWDTEDDIPKNSKGNPIISLEDDRTADGKDINIKIYRPKRPCSTVIIHDGDEKSCKDILANRYHIFVDRVKFYTPNEKKGGVKGIVSNLVKRNKVETATFFCKALDDPKKGLKALKHELLTNCNGRSMKTVQVLFDDGSIIYLK